MKTRTISGDIGAMKMGTNSNFSLPELSHGSIISVESACATADYRDLTTDQFKELFFAESGFTDHDYDTYFGLLDYGMDEPIKRTNTVNVARGRLGGIFSNDQISHLVFHSEQGSRIEHEKLRIINEQVFPSVSPFFEWKIEYELGGSHVEARHQSANVDVYVTKIIAARRLPIPIVELNARLVEAGGDPRVVQFIKFTTGKEQSPTELLTANGYRGMKIGNKREEDIIRMSLLDGVFYSDRALIMRSLLNAYAPGGGSHREHLLLTFSDKFEKASSILLKYPFLLLSPLVLKEVGIVPQLIHAPFENAVARNRMYISRLELLLKRLQMYVPLDQSMYNQPMVIGAISILHALEDSFLNEGTVMLPFKHIMETIGVTNPTGTEQALDMLVRHHDLLLQVDDCLGIFTFAEPQLKFASLLNENKMVAYCVLDVRFWHVWAADVKAAVTTYETNQDAVVYVIPDVRAPDLRKLGTVFHGVCMTESQFANAQQDVMADLSVVVFLNSDELVIEHITIGLFRCIMYLKAVLFVGDTFKQHYPNAIIENGKYKGPRPEFFSTLVMLIGKLDFIQSLSAAKEQATSTASIDGENRDSQNKTKDNHQTPFLEHLDKSGIFTSTVRDSDFIRSWVKEIPECDERIYQAIEQDEPDNIPPFSFSEDDLTTISQNLSDANVSIRNMHVMVNRQSDKFQAYEKKLRKPTQRRALFKKGTLVFWKKERRIMVLRKDGTAVDAAQLVVTSPVDKTPVNVARSDLIPHMYIDLKTVSEYDLHKVDIVVIHIDPSFFDRTKAKVDVTHIYRAISSARKHCIFAGSRKLLARCLESHPSPQAPPLLAMFRSENLSGENKPKMWRTPGVDPDLSLIDEHEENRTPWYRLRRESLSRSAWNELDHVLAHDFDIYHHKIMDSYEVGASSGKHKRTLTNISDRGTSISQSMRSVGAPLGSMKTLSHGSESDRSLDDISGSDVDSLKTGSRGHSRSNSRSPSRNASRRTSRVIQDEVRRGSTPALRVSDRRRQSQADQRRASVGMVPKDDSRRHSVNTLMTNPGALGRRQSRAGESLEATRAGIEMLLANAGGLDHDPRANKDSRSTSMGKARSRRGSLAMMNLGDGSDLPSRVPVVSSQFMDSDSHTPLEKQDSMEGLDANQLAMFLDGLSKPRPDESKAQRRARQLSPLLRKETMLNRAESLRDYYDQKARRSNEANAVVGNLPSIPASTHGKRTRRSQQYTTGLLVAPMTISPSPTERLASDPNDDKLGPMRIPGDRLLSPSKQKKKSNLEKHYGDLGYRSGVYGKSIGGQSESDFFIHKKKKTEGLAEALDKVDQEMGQGGEQLRPSIIRQDTMLGDFDPGARPSTAAVMCFPGTPKGMLPGRSRPATSFSLMSSSGDALSARSHSSSRSGSRSRPHSRTHSRNASGVLVSNTLNMQQMLMERLFKPDQPQSNSTLSASSDFSSGNDHRPSSWISQ